MASAACAMSASRVAGVCSVSGRDGSKGGAASRASRGAVRLSASHRGAAGRRALFSGRNNDDAAGGNAPRASSRARASLVEPGVEPSTFARRPEDVVASNGREVEQFALQCCVKRQTAGLFAPAPSIPQDMLDQAYERCREVTGEYAKTFYLGACTQRHEHYFPRCYLHAQIRGRQAPPTPGARPIAALSTIDKLFPPNTFLLVDFVFFSPRLSRCHATNFSPRLSRCQCNQRNPIHRNLTMHSPPIPPFHPHNQAPS